MSGRPYRGALTAAAVLACLLAVLSGCRTNFSAPSGPGVVVDRWAVLIHGVEWRHLVVQVPGVGRQDTLVGYRTYTRCHVGDRWPACRDGAR